MPEELAVSNLTVRTKTGCCSAPQLTILQDVSFSLQRSQLTAVIGPSGSGKSTLLSYLSGRLRLQKSMTATASLWLDGDSIPICELRKRTAYIGCEDEFLLFLSVEQTLDAAVRLRCPNLNGNTRRKRVERLLHEFDLLSCRKFNIGGSRNHNTVSDGQSRRIHTAIETVGDVDTLLVDEPTSNQGPNHGDTMIEQLQAYAVLKKKFVLCSLHQASSKIFYKLDNVLLLAHGQIIYAGPPHSAVAFVEAMLSKGPCPEDVNHADYVIDYLTSLTPDMSKMCGRIGTYTPAIVASVECSTPVSCKSSQFFEQKGVASLDAHMAVDDSCNSPSTQKVAPPSPKPSHVLEGERLTSVERRPASHFLNRNRRMFFAMVLRSTLFRFRNRMLLLTTLGIQLFMGCVTGVIFFNQYQKSYQATTVDTVPQLLQRNDWGTLVSQWTSAITDGIIAGSELNSTNALFPITIGLHSGWDGRASHVEDFLLQQSTLNAIHDFVMCSRRSMKLETRFAYPPVTFSLDDTNRTTSRRDPKLLSNELQAEANRVLSISDDAVTTVAAGLQILDFVKNKMDLSAGLECFQKPIFTMMSCLQKSDIIEVVDANLMCLGWPPVKKEHSICPPFETCSEAASRIWYSKEVEVPATQERYLRLEEQSEITSAEGLPSWDSGIKLEVDSVVAGVLESMTLVASIFFVIAYVTFVSLEATISMHPERAVFNKETVNKLYDPVSFFVAKNIADLPFQVVPVGVMAVAFFLLVGLPGNLIWHCLFIVMMCSFAAYGVGYVVAVASRTLSAGIRIHSVLIILMFIFSGFLLREADQPRAFGWLRYLSCCRWTFCAIIAHIYPLSGKRTTINLLHQLMAGVTEQSYATCVVALLGLGLGYRVVAFFVLVLFNRDVITA